MLITVKELSRDFGVSAAAIRMILWRHKGAFLPRYMRREGHPRLIRVLTKGEANRVRKMLVREARPA